MLKDFLLHRKSVKQCLLKPTGGEPVPKPKWQEYGVIAEKLIADGTTATVTDWVPQFGDQWELTYTTFSTTLILVGAGARTASTASDQFIALITATAFYVANGGMSRNGFLVEGSSRPVPNKKYTFKFNKDEVSVNNTVVAYASSKNNAPVQFALGTVNNNGVLDKRFHIGTYYELIVDAEDGTPKHHLVPFCNTLKEITDKKGKNYPINSFFWWDLIADEMVGTTVGDWDGQIKSDPAELLLRETVTNNMLRMGITPTNNIEEDINSLNRIGVEI